MGGSLHVVSAGERGAAALRVWHMCEACISFDPACTIYRQSVLGKSIVASRFGELPSACKGLQYSFNVIQPVVQEGLSNYLQQRRRPTWTYTEIRRDSESDNVPQSVMRGVG